MKQDREAVRTLAIQVGVREAARQLNLNENTVVQWSKRYQWFKRPTLPPTHNDSKAVISVIKPGDALLSEIQQNGTETKLKLSRYAKKQAEHLATKGKLKDHNAFRNLTTGAGVLHGWNEEKAEGKFTLNVLNLGALEITAGPPERAG